MSKSTTPAATTTSPATAAPAPATNGTAEPTAPAPTPAPPETNGKHPSPSAQGPVPQPLDLAPYQPLLDQMAGIESWLNTRALERGDVIRGILVALLSGEHVVLVGAPGSAKSMLMNDLAACLTDPLTPGGLKMFALLLTKYTTPEELTGPLSLRALENDEYRHITTGRLADAYLVLLDEWAKGSSAILNTILQAINERTFNNGAETVAIPLLTLIGASNEIPDDPGLSAIWDRMTIRFKVEYLSSSGRAKMLRQAAQRTQHKMVGAHARRAAELAGVAYTPQQTVPPVQITLDDLLALQAAVPQVLVPDEVLAALDAVATQLHAAGITPSDRRWSWIPGILKAHAMLEGKGAVDLDDLVFLQHLLWERPEQRAQIEQIVGRLASPVAQKGKELSDKAASVYAAAQKVFDDPKVDDKGKAEAGIDALAKIKKVRVELRELIKNARGQGLNVGRLEKLEAAMGDNLDHIGRIVFGTEDES